MIIATYKIELDGPDGPFGPTVEVDAVLKSDYDVIAARESLLTQEVETLKAEYAQLEVEMTVYKAHTVAPSIIEGLFDRWHVAKTRIAALESELAADNDLFQRRWREWQSERDTLVDRVQWLEAALRDIYEVYAGSDGFVPQYASEAYQQRLLKQMADIAAATFTKETTVSTLCAICDQIKELHPSTHPWTAKETKGEET